MNTHTLNKELSQKVYDAVKPQMELKMCYNNIFRTVHEFYDKFKYGDYKIAYGYMQTLQNLYVRHCFILNEDGEVIDPTLCCIEDRTGRKDEPKDYISFAILGLREYLDMLEDNNYYPDLARPLHDKEMEALSKAPELGLLLIG